MGGLEVRGHPGILIKFETTMPELMETLSQKKKKGEKKKQKQTNKKLFSGSKASSVVQHVQDYGYDSHPLHPQRSDNSHLIPKLGIG